MSEKEFGSFYYVIPAEIMHSKDLCLEEKLIYGLISGLSNKKGYCFAGNDFFEETLNIKETTVKKYIKNLEDKGFIQREIHSFENNPFKKERRIYLAAQFKKSLPESRTRPLGEPCARPPVGRERDPIISEENTLISEDTHTPPSKASADAVRACKFFIEKIKEVNPKFKDPNLEKWEKEFDCILKVDKRDVEELCDMIQWVFKHDFWKSRCLSPGNLRKQFDSIYMQRQSETKMNASEDNKSFAVALKKKYPDKLKNLTISPKYAMKLDSGKELPFSLPVETFRNALCQMFGGRYEPNPESGKDSDVEHTE
jgi:DNA-binding Lrp family transcriptional regulator